MPTKILAVETSNFPVGDKLAKIAEKVEPSAFPARLQQYFDAEPTSVGSKPLLFVLAQRDQRGQPIFDDALKGPLSVGVAFFENPIAAWKTLPSLPVFVNPVRTSGVKDCLAKGSVIYSESFFGWKGVGAKLDPCMSLARQQFPVVQASKVWKCVQQLLFFGLQHLPELGEKGSGEKIDIQVGTDEKALAVNVRYELSAEAALALRSSPEICAASTGANVCESRFFGDSKKLEVTCLFFRGELATGTAIDILTYQRDTALDDSQVVKEYLFKPFSCYVEGAAAVKNSFKKTFSQQAQALPQAPAAATSAPAADDKLQEALGLESAKEKEMRKLADKAVLAKEEALKKLLELEIKANKAEVAASTKITQLERTLQETKNEKTELEKLVGELTLKMHKPKVA